MKNYVGCEDRKDHAPHTLLKGGNLELEHTGNITNIRGPNNKYLRLEQFKRTFLEEKLVLSPQGSGEPIFCRNQDNLQHVVWSKVDFFESDMAKLIGPQRLFIHISYSKQRRKVRLNIQDPKVIF